MKSLHSPNIRHMHTILFVSVGLLVLTIMTSLGVKMLNPTHAAVALKPMGAGLYTDGFNASTVNHEFLNIAWSSLETSPGTFNWSQIDNELRAHPNNFFRLRLESGTTWGAGGWICKVSGVSCHLITHAKTATSGTTPSFWTSAYLARYNSFIQAAGARYDSNPQVLDVVNGACMTFTAEPFILGGTGPGSAADVLYKAGLSVASDTACLVQSSADIVAAFPHTRVSVATFDGMQEPGGSSWTDERNVLQTLKAAHGSQMIFQNNGFTQVDGCSQAGVVTPANAGTNMCYLKAVGPPMGFQRGCGSKGTVCSDPAIVDNVVAMGGCFIEHATWIDLGTAEASYDTKLKNVAGCSSNAPPPVMPGDCSGPSSRPDGRVNAFDFSLLLTHDNTSYPPCDFTPSNGTSVIGAADSNALTSHWTW